MSGKLSTDGLLSRRRSLRDDLAAHMIADRGSLPEPYVSFSTVLFVAVMAFFPSHNCASAAAATSTHDCRGPWAASTSMGRQARSPFCLAWADVRERRILLCCNMNGV